jgi:hypothetical protein
MGHSTRLGGYDAAWAQIKPDSLFVSCVRKGFLLCSQNQSVCPCVGLEEGQARRLALVIAAYFH